MLERLETDKVIAIQEENIDSKELFSVTKKLIYDYDFGDNLIVTITKKKDCGDLLKRNVISYKELVEANETVLINHKPVCINEDGVYVIDNVGVSKDLLIF